MRTDFSTCLQSSYNGNVFVKVEKNVLEETEYFAVRAYKSVKSNKNQTHAYLERWWLWHFHVLQAEHKNAYVCKISHKVAGYVTQSS